MSGSTAQPEMELGWQELAVLIGARLVLNTAFRVVYPLLPVLAAALGVSLEQVSLLVTVQVGATLLSPLGGLITDRYGDRVTLLAGLSIFTLGATICAPATSLSVFLLGYSLIGLGTALFMPAMQTYASNRSTYGQRGRVLGLLELSWAAAALVGVTGLTMLVQLGGGWALAGWVMAGMAALMTLLTACLPASPQPVRSASTEDAGAVPILSALRLPGVSAGLALIFLQLFAVELIFVVYGSWLSSAFRATTEQLGLIFGLLGLVELVGASAATLWTDRLGKRRAVLSGFSGVGLLMLLLPLSEGNWFFFLGLFLLFDLCFEFAIVSTFPLMSGLSRNARGSIMALTVVAIGLGRISGSLLGPRIFASIGFWSNGVLAGTAALAGVALGLLLVREGQH